MGVSWEKPEARGGMGEREKSTCQAEKERHRIYVRNSKAAVTEVKRIKRNRVEIILERQTGCLDLTLLNESS